MPLTVHLLHTKRNTEVGTVIAAFKLLLEEMWIDKSITVLNPASLIRCLTPRFSECGILWGQQHDAHEVLSLLLDIMDLELKPRGEL